MRRKTFADGSYVKVTNASGIYKDLQDIAKDLGYKEEKWNKGIPEVGKEGEVVGTKEGYVLVDFGEYQSLMDFESLQQTIKPSDAKILVRYSRNNTLEEFENTDQLKARIQELVKTGNIRLDETLKVYEVSSVKTLKMGLEVSLG